MQVVACRFPHSDLHTPDKLRRSLVLQIEQSLNAVLIVCGSGEPNKIGDTSGDVWIQPDSKNGLDKPTRFSFAHAMWCHWPSRFEVWRSTGCPQVGFIDLTVDRTREAIVKYGLPFIDLNEVPDRPLTTGEFV